MKTCNDCDRIMKQIDLYDSHRVNMGYGECADGFHRDRRTTTSHYACPKCKRIYEYLDWDGSF